LEVKDLNEDKEEMVPLSAAENEVMVVVNRLTLLHLSYAKTLVDTFGWEKGKQLVLNAIREYGRRVGERMKQGLQSTPKYGFWERREGKPRLCWLGKWVAESGEMDIGSLYCLIDPAKNMWVNENEKLIHTKCLTVGDDICAFERVPTTEKDREDFFAENRDWAHVDPRLEDFYKEKHGK